MCQSATLQINDFTYLYTHKVTLYIITLDIHCIIYVPCTTISNN